jgi:hypothetical protein
MIGGSSSTKPPRLARLLVHFACEKGDRSFLLGDLEEEFSLRARHSPGKARSWYWRQAIKSLPHLASLACARADILSLAAATVLGYVAVFAWDSSVSSNAARWFAQAVGTSPPFTLPRAIYVVMQLAGCILVGAAFALTAFRPQAFFWRNVAVRLLPLVALLMVPTGFFLAARADAYPIAIRVAWLAGVFPSLVFGAWAGWLLRKR